MALFNYQSPGSAAAEGFAQGGQLGLGLAREQREKAAQQQDMDIRQQQLGMQQQEHESVQAQRKFEQGRQTNADEERKDQLALAALDKESEMHAGVMAGHYQASGGNPGNIPKDQHDADIQKAHDIAGKRDQLYQKIYAPRVQATQQKYNDLASGMQTGRVDLNQMSPKDLYMTLGVSMKDDPMKLVRHDGQPSVIDNGSQQIQEGMKTGNQSILLQGMNTVLSPDLQKDVGKLAKDGSRIEKKEIVHIAPDPHGQGKFMPVVQVTTKRADGAEGITYEPLKSNDDGGVPFHDIGKAVDYLGHLNVLGEAANNPQMQQKLIEGKKQAGAELDDYLSAYHQIGGKRANIQKAVTNHEIDLGNRKVQQTVDESGNVVGERSYAVGAKPRVFNPNVGVGRASKDLDTIQNYAEDNNMSEADAADKLQEMGIIRTPRAAGGGTGRGISETATKGDVRTGTDAAASDIGAVWNPQKKSYMQQNGAPLTADQQSRISKAEEAANTTARDSAASGKRAKSSDLIEAARNAAKNAPIKVTIPSSIKTPSGRNSETDFTDAIKTIRSGVPASQVIERMVSKGGYKQEDVVKIINQNMK